MNKKLPNFIHATYVTKWSIDELSSAADLQALVTIDTPDSKTRRDIQNGRECLEVSNPIGAPWLYVRLPPSAVGIGKQVKITVRILGDVRTGVWIEYDSLDNAVEVVPGLPGAFKRTSPVQLSGEGEFETLKFELNDARFEKRVNTCDFRIVADKSDGSAMHIAQVNVSQIAPVFDAVQTVPFRWRSGFLFRGSGRCSIVIPMRNRVNFTLQCLNYLKKNTLINCELIVVDDGSCEQDLAEIRKVRGITLIENPENIGFARSCNIGAKSARTPNILFLNNDTIPLEAWLEPLLRILDEHPDTGIVGSKLLFPGKWTVQHAGIAFDRFGLPYHLGLYRENDDPAVNQNRVVGAVTGACLLTRREVFAQLGGFDESYTNGYEDIDYCLRAAEQGYLTRYCADSELCHYESITEGRINYLAEVANRNLFLERWLHSEKALPDRQNETKTVVSGENEPCAPRFIAFYDSCDLPESGYTNDFDRSLDYWDVVTSSQPMFEHHHQPREQPLAGEYDVHDASVIEQQAKIARQYGIEGFCFHVFGPHDLGRRGQPLVTMLAKDKPGIPFCVCWVIQGADRHTDKLSEQESDALNSTFLDRVMPLLDNPRYILLDRKPLLLVAQSRLLQAPYALTEMWRQACRQAGIGEIVLAAEPGPETEHPPDGFDMVFELPPGRVGGAGLQRSIKSLKPGFEGSVYDYFEYMRERVESGPKPYPYCPSVMLEYDSSPLSGSGASIFHGFTSGNFEYWLSELVDQAGCGSASREMPVFMYAWNDWLNGCCLEPDGRYGYGKLEAVRRVYHRAQTLGRVAKRERSRLFSVLQHNLAQLDDGSEQAQTWRPAPAAGHAFRFWLENSFGSATGLLQTGDLAVVVHAYYPDIFEDLLTRLKSLGDLPFDLFVSTTKEHETTIRQSLKRRGMNNATVYVFENRGRDVLPFLKILPELSLAGYRFIIKVHTKQSLHRADGQAWGQEMFSALLDSRRIELGLAKMMAEKDVGILGPGRYLLPTRYYISSNGQRVLEMGKRMGLTEEHILETQFVGGTMFMARVGALEKLLSLSLKDEDFEPELGQLDGTMAHAIERVISLCVISEGMRITSFRGYDGGGVSFSDPTLAPKTDKHVL